MASRPNFTKAAIKRVVDGLTEKGLSIAGVEVNDNGFIVLVGEATSRKRKNMADELYGPQT